MFAEERHRAITDLLATTGRVNVTELATRFAITPETIRKDLATLEDSGQLRRVHGGAVALNRGAAIESDVDQRSAAHLAEKTAIARRVLARLPRSGPLSLLLDAGTTTLAVAHELAAAKFTEDAPLTVITNSLSIASTLASSKNIHVHLLGGRLRGITQALVGASTIRALGTFRPDIALIGTNAINAGFGLSTPDPDEAAVKSAMIANARRVVVLADASKLDTESLTHFGTVADIDALITTGEPGPELAEALNNADVEVVPA